MTPEEPFDLEAEDEDQYDGCDEYDEGGRERDAPETE
jgi:hypothetical protein